MKKLLALILIITGILAIGALSVSAADIVANGTCGDDLTWTLDDTGTLTISGEGNMNNWTDSYTSRVPWYYKKENIMKVIIENGVTSIGEYAFSDCDSLTSITIPDSVTNIGKYAFYSCGLTSITIPGSVTSIGEYAFNACVFSTSLTIGDGVTSIGHNAFFNCHRITSITIPDSVTSIEDGAFAYCNRLTDIYVGINNKNYSSVNGVLFNKDKTTLIQYPKGKTNTSYSIPNSVTSIGGYVFYGCSGLTSITIPEGVTSIGSRAFDDCSGITSITIPNGVISIGSYAFKDCTNLTKVNITSIEAWCNITFGEMYSNPLIYAKNLYINGTLITNIVIPDVVTSIGSYAFFNCYHITSITIPDSVTSIGEYTFSGCSGLTSVIIPDSVTSIGKRAFGGCRSLTNITIGKGVTIIGDYSFNECNSLKSVAIPNGVTSIGSYAFYNCSSLISIIIPDSVKSIGEFALSGCSSLTSVTIGKGVTNIGTDAFSCCRSLTQINWNAINVEDFQFQNCVFSYAGENGEGINVIFGDEVETIPAHCFYSDYLNNPKITSVTIPDSVTRIGSSVFLYGVTKVKITSIEAWCEIDFQGSLSAKNLYLNDTLITNLVIPDGVTSIGSKAFKNCSSLTSVTIPDSVTGIGDYAFDNCSNLTSVTMGNDVTSIGEYAFNMCNSLTTVYYNGNQENWAAITIGTYNDKLNSAKKHFFAYVDFVDKYKNKIISTKQNIDECIDTSSVVIPEGYDLVLYTDEDFIQKYDINTPIAENLTLYVDFIKLNKIDFEGTATADIGEKGITQSVSFATDKTAKYLSCTLKVPNSLEIQEIKSDIFEVEQDYEIIDNDTHYYLFLIYSGDRNIPTYQTLNAFEIVLDVSENAVADEMLAIEIFDDAILADDDGNSYGFTSIEKAEIKVNPIFAEEITIVGADEIDAPTQYTVSVLPENTTNSNVEWSVSDETIATISEDGVLTPVKKGNVTVRATAKDGSGVYAEKTVSVKVLGTVNSITTNIGIWDKEYSPDTTNYTTYVPESTTSIRLTAKHDGTFKTDKTTFVNNVTRTVTLSTTSDETVLDLVYTCEGYDNNKYTITIIKFEGTKTEVSEDKKSFSITPINVENGKTVILALYNGEQFVEMQSAVYTGEVVPFTTTKSYTKAKVMVWDDLTNLKPVCEVENIQ